MQLSKTPCIIKPPKDIKIDTTKDNLSIGKALWSAIGLDEDSIKLTKEILPIIIQSDNSQILQLPWELLYHPKYGELGKHPNCTLSRNILNLTNSSTPIEKRALRVLFFSTLPDDIDEDSRLAVEKEQEEVLETILPYRQEGLIDIKMPNDGRFESLKQLIESYRPDVVFLSGHSGFRDGKGFFLFEDKFGFSVYIDEEELKGAFVGSSVECVVLSSCQSAQLDSIDSGLVMSLAFYGISNVVGMSQSIYDKAGRSFAKEFMKQISTKKPIAYAVQKAREEIAKELEEPFKNHWYLPILVSSDIYRDLVDWNFQPKPPSTEKLNQKLNQILYPSNYIGRRKEFRVFYNYLYNHKLKKLLLYGEGGIGKTAMVAKFGLELRKEGYKVFDYSLKDREKLNWKKFIKKIKRSLSLENKNNLIETMNEFSEDPYYIAEEIADILLEEHKKVAFIFDNLESIQEPNTKELTDTKIKSWIDALSEIEGVVVLLTSRWLLPNCKHSIHLTRPLKSDFLYFLSNQNINLHRRDKLEKIYNTFGGNYRGVEFFLSAIGGMSSDDEDSFLESLSKAKESMRVDMAIEKILSYLNQDEMELLKRLSVYDVAVPKEGVINISLNLPQDTVEKLVSFSLVEKSYNLIYQVDEYQISALVYEFIKDEINLSEEVKKHSADYLFWLFLEERKTLSWAMVAYNALKRVDNIEALERWLFDIQSKEDIKLKGLVLNQIGIENYKLANYSKALEYLEKSLEIRVAIGDKVGLCATLFNIGHIYYDNDEVAKALGAWLDAYNIAKEIEYAEVLNALDKLAQSGGFENFEALKKQITQE